MHLLHQNTIDRSSTVLGRKDLVRVEVFAAQRTLGVQGVFPVSLHAQREPEAMFNQKEAACGREETCREKRTKARFESQKKGNLQERKL